MPPETSAGRGILASIRRHPLVIAFVAGATLLNALAFLQRREPTYEASAQILVTPIPEFDRAFPQLPLPRSAPDRARVIQTAANLLDSPEAAELAARQLGEGWTGDRVGSIVDVLPEGESDVLAVTARAEDGETAAEVANAFAAAAVKARERVIAPIVADAIRETERDLDAVDDQGSALATDLADRLATLRAIQAAGDPTVSVSRRADAPSAASGPSNLMLAALALLAGLAAGVAVALVVDMLGTPVVASAAHAVALTGLPVLARVPRLRIWQRLRRSSLQPLRPGAVIAFRKLQHQLPQRRRAGATGGSRRSRTARAAAAGDGQARSILLVGSSVGDGVTTSVAEFGFTLASAGHDVLVIDLDARDPKLAARLGASEPSTLASLGPGEPWTSALTTVPGIPRLQLAAVGAHGALGIPDDMGATLPNLVRTACEQFHYVLVDAPPLAESGDALRVTGVVDAIVLVVRPGSTRVPDLENAVDLIERVHRRPDGLLVVGGPAPRTDPLDVPVEPEDESASEAAPLRPSSDVESHPADTAAVGRTRPSANG